LSHSPIFQVMLILQNTPVEPLSLGELQVAPIEFESSQTGARADAAFGLKETLDGIVGTVEYNTDLFDRSTILQLISSFEYLLEQIVALPQAVIQDLRVIRGEADEQQVVHWNSTGMTYPEQETLHGMVERQAQLNPTKIALRVGGQTLTYDELNRRANRRAHALLQQGLQPESCVGICLSRTPEIIISMLAVLKAGGCYVPVDPSYPAPRVQYLLNDAEMFRVITTRELQGALNIPPAKCLFVDAGDVSELDTDPRLDISSSQLAYIIYTSGSTGRPKGVAMAHQGAVSLLEWARAVVPEHDRAGVLACTSICFDLSVYEIFLPLTSGQTCIVIDDILSIELMDAESKQQVTLMNTVPSAAKALLDRKAFPSAVRVLNLAGEPLKAALVDRLYAETSIGKVYDLYGPSECTTYSSFALRRLHGPETIGTPVANTQFYVLDSGGQLLPRGVVGELYIGGVGVARGYLQRGALTAEKFIPDRFSNRVGARLYRTGDLVRYRQDGSLEYLGRADHQVKVRGFRIELGEIESALLQHSDVSDAVVIVREDHQDHRQIVAYFVPRNRSVLGALGAEASLVDSLKEHLQRFLPSYMMPATFIGLASMPLTPNGKLDRKELPAPHALADVPCYVAPQGEMEHRVAGLWEQLLKRGPVGRFDNFFELGGHSLLVTQMASRIEEVLSIAVDIRVFYKYSTLKDIAARLAQMVSIDVLGDEVIDKMSEEEATQLLSEFEALE
jgi:amino acid adenylation domain-containing protein